MSSGLSYYPSAAMSISRPVQRWGFGREKLISSHHKRWAFADVKSTYAKMSRITKAKQPFREITKESLELEPLCKELLAYFAERMISGETLWRNSVMQKGRGTQETDTGNIFYGLDDIKGASDIIIVEGEIDKLGFKNCVSVPDGAPPKASNKELPSAEEASLLRFSNISCLSSIVTITFDNMYTGDSSANKTASSSLSLSS